MIKRLIVFIHWKFMETLLGEKLLVPIKNDVLNMHRPFEQNIIALIWDFDKTLAKDYMQKPIFHKYGVDEQEFWKENNSLVEKYKNMGIKVSKDTIYLNHLLTCVEQGILEGLNNSLLRELGQEINFYEGLPDFFSMLKV